MKKLFLALMLVLGFGLNVFASNNTPESVILGFATAIQNEDFEKAKNFLNKPSFIKPIHIFKPHLGTKNTLETEIQGFYRHLTNSGSDYKTFNNVKDWNFKVEKDTNGINNYSLLMINPNFDQRWTSLTSGTKYDSSKNFELIKINNEWKITGWI